MRIDTQRLILELLTQEYRKAKFLYQYQKEIKDARSDFIKHVNSQPLRKE